MFDNFESAKISVNDVGIDICCAGNGEPLLLLHGFPQTKAMWARVAPILAKHYRVICADLRGYGHSSKPPAADDDASNYTFRQMASDNVQLMQSLGYDRFHVVGHDRGGRVGYRMALDHTPVVKSLSVLDIVPTHAMFNKTSQSVASAYWHWYFLSQPKPFPEDMIKANPDLFFETCLVGWGATSIEGFDKEQLDEYRRAWRNPEMIAGACADYRAAARLDVTHDAEGLANRVSCPVLVLYGSNGVMASLFDIPGEWRKICDSVVDTSLPGGHFFVDQFPEATAEIVDGFVRGGIA